MFVSSRDLDDLDSTEIFLQLEKQDSPQAALLESLDTNPAFHGQVRNRKSVDANENSARLPKESQRDAIFAETAQESMLTTGELDPCLFYH